MRGLSRWIPVIGGAIAGGVIALIIASGSGSSTHTVSTRTVTATQQSALPTAFTPSTKQGLSIHQIYEQDRAGVVDIFVTARTSQPTFGFFGGGSGLQQGEGAGVVYDAKGDILTDEHVVAHEVSIKVNFQNGKSYPATVVGTDPSTDVAVIHVNAPTSELHPIAFGNSDSAQVGDPVVAIGSPFSLPETVTAGIVSQTGRPIQAPNGFTILGAIQTDAPINPGNSGGPLLDAYGHVLGLNDQIVTNTTGANGQGQNSGVGFAVPANTVVQIANRILSGHPIQHPFVGVCLAPAATGGGAQIEAGAQCTPAVQPGSPAANAGLKQGDVITAVDGKQVTSTDDFISMVGNYSPGQTVTFTIKRGSQTVNVKVKLATRPAQAPGISSSP